jgi:arylsulfatase A-like enzyme
MNSNLAVRSPIAARLCRVLLLSLTASAAWRTPFPKLTAAELAPPAAQPNILIFLADDLGWRDVPWHGSEYAMPHLDALAKESVKLEAHYVHPMCSPTRAALLSGRYASRFGCTGAQNERVFPFDTVTLASALKSVGYETALTGKWHLGSLPEWGPKKFGFDHAYGSLAGGVGPYDHHYKKGPYTETWHRNGASVSEEGHVTDLIAREAIAFLEKKRSAPFFLYVPFTAVHIPIDEPQAWLDKNSQLSDPGDRLHAATASHMDGAIGQVLTALEKSGHRDDTLVLFFSDNGGHGPTQNNDTQYPGKYPDAIVGRDNKPLRGKKTELYEGGIRSSTIVRYPGMLRPQTVDAPVHAADWMPTLTKLAGYRPAQDLKWDGTDIWPTLAGTSPATKDRTLYWLGVRNRAQALRRGRWKLHVLAGKPAELFDLAADPSEENDLAGKHPDIVADLTRRMAEAAARDGESRVVDDTRKPPSN